MISASYLEVRKKCCITTFIYLWNIHFMSCRR